MALSRITMYQCAVYCYEAGFTTEEKLTTAVAVAYAESGLRTGVVNHLGCTGLFQIYVRVHLPEHPSWTTAAMKIPFNNCKAAWWLSSGGVNWKPWEAYTKGMHKKYMGNARIAARSVIKAAPNQAYQPASTISKTTAAAPGPALSTVLATAASQIGYVEQGSNRTKYWTELNPGLQGNAWCAAFTHWVLKKNGIDITKMGCSNPYHCFTIRDWAKRTGRWTSTPRPGYLVIYHYSHIGIVEKVLGGGKIQTIEGNTSGGSRGSQNNGGGVWRKTRSSSISGYVRIDYDTSAVAGSRVSPVASATPAATVKLTVQETGAWNQQTANQLALVAEVPIPFTSNATFWRGIEQWVGLEGKWVDGDLDLVTVKALQWRTNQPIIDGAWNSRTILGIQKYLNAYTV